MSVYVMLTYEATSEEQASKFKDLILTHVIGSSLSAFRTDSFEEDDQKLCSAVVQLLVDNEDIEYVLEQIDNVRFMRLNIKDDVYNHIYGGSRVSVLPHSAIASERQQLTSDIVSFIHERSQYLEEQYKSVVMVNNSLRSRIQDLEEIAENLVEKYASIQCYLHDVARIGEMKQIITSLAERTDNDDILEKYEIHKVH